MKYLQALVPFLLIAVVFHGWCRFAARQHVSRAVVAGVYVLAACVSVMCVLLTPTENRAQWSMSDPSLQFVTLEQDASAGDYARALVAVPSLLPFPAVTGKVVAKSVHDVLLQARWDNGQLLVEPLDLDGRPAQVICGEASVRGLPVRYPHQGAVQACPA